VNVPKGRKIARLDTVELVAWRNKARVGVEKASRDLERVKKLYSDSVATLEQLQNAQSAFTAAQSDLEIASFNLSQAVLVAPTSGKILRRLTEKNEVVGPGMPVVVFASTDGKWVVKSSVPDRDLSVIAIGDSAAVIFDALPQKVFTAILVRIAGAAHPVTGTFEIECALQKTHSRFRPGLIADIRLYPQQQKKVVFIPARALVNGTGKQGTVYTVGSNDSIVALQVTVERIFDDLLAVSSGLENVDSIIINGAEYVWYSTGPIVIERN
jgi:RND family efflux transporter MFP subunit